MELTKFETHSFLRGTKKKPAVKPELLIGCPIQKREWIIEEWWEHAFYSADKAGFKPGFIFVIGDNEPLLQKMILNLAELYTTEVHFMIIDEEERADARVWNSGRYEKMVWLRNLLLQGVRDINPKWFLSLDSDMLLAIDAVSSLVYNIGDAGAIGGCAYMSHLGNRIQSWGTLTSNNNLRRGFAEGVMPVDVIMAIKLMTPAAFNVNYEYDTHGEDIGICKAWKRAGLKLMWDGTVVNKHVMMPADLDKIDPRVGF